MSTSMMQQLLEHFLEEAVRAGDIPAGENAAIAGQITFTNGQVIRGAIARGPVPGSYRMLTEAVLEQQGRRMSMPAEVFFGGDAIFSLMLQKELKTVPTPSLITRPT